MAARSAAAIPEVPDQVTYTTRVDQEIDTYKATLTKKMQGWLSLHLSVS